MIATNDNLTILDGGLMSGLSGASLRLGSGSTLGSGSRFDGDGQHSLLSLFDANAQSLNFLRALREPMVSRERKYVL